MKTRGQTVFAWLLLLISLLPLCWSRTAKQMQVPVMSIFTMSQTSSVPRIIHQSWKDSQVPKKYRAWQQSWKDMHPNWQYNLWTDEMNQELVETHFRWYLPIFNRFPLAIFKADTARYMYMYKFGGVYADLDFRALRPMDRLLNGMQPQAIIGQLSNDTAWSNNFPNAWLASSPGHPFWMYCLMEIARFSLLVECEGANCTNGFTVEKTTGPMMLWRATNLYAELGRLGKDPQLRILEPKAVYPLNWRPNHFDTRCQDMKDEIDCYRHYPDSYAITYWSHGWAR